MQFLKNLDPIEEIDLFPIILINLNSLQSSNTDDLFKSRFLSHLIIISLILVSLNDSVPIWDKFNTPPMFERLTHPLKAKSPIWVILSDILISFKYVLFSKAPLAILLILKYFGKTTLLSLPKYWISMLSLPLQEYLKLEFILAPVKSAIGLSWETYTVIPSQLLKILLSAFKHLFIIYSSEILQLLKAFDLIFEIELDKINVLMLQLFFSELVSMPTILSLPEEEIKTRSAEP